MTACKRLIEVDYPLDELSARPESEKNVRHGRVLTLQRLWRDGHNWMDRRRAVAARAIRHAAAWPASRTGR